MAISRRALLIGLATAGAARSLHAAAAGFVELRAYEIKQPLLSSSAELWSFNGTVPGPLLRARQGDEFRARVVNDLAEPISVHWHGIRLANAMDGTSLTQSPIPPGAFFDYVFVPPDAGTFWYHTTIDSSVQRERGLYGMVIVDGQGILDGYFDLPIVIDDWRLTESGELDEMSFGSVLIASGEGRLGGRLTINGADRARLTAPADRHLRLRIVNAANARAFRLLLSADALVIAHDGQPAKPLPLTAGELFPGQRLDLLIPPGQAPLAISAVSQDGATALASIARTGPPAAAWARAVSLRPNPLPDYFNYAALHDVSFTIEGGGNGYLKEARFGGVIRSKRELAERGMVWAVNGHAGLSSEPLFAVPRGVTVAITVDNITRITHVLHIHGHAARLVEIAGRPVMEPVWRDTFVAKPLEPAKILFIADNPGKWLIASSIAEHLEAGLQAWFEVR